MTSHRRHRDRRENRSFNPCKNHLTGVESLQPDDIDLDGISGGGLTSRNTDRVGSSRSPGHNTIPAYNNVSLLDNIIEV